MKMKRPAEDKDSFQLTKWLKDSDFGSVTATLDQGNIQWRLEPLGEGADQVYSIWREKRGYVRRTK